MTGGQQTGGAFSAGNDTYVWTLEDVVNSDGIPVGFDRITEFGARDRLDISAIFAGSGQQPQLPPVRLTDTGQDTVVAADVGGDQYVDIVPVERVHDLDIDSIVVGGSAIL